MADYQQVVDELRAILQSYDQTLSDHLRELAEAYAQACRDANQRLRRCDEFLQKGLRSEAVHLARAEPDLLDMVAALDFPERPKWEELCVFYRLPDPQKLLLTTAEALNEAYARVQPLEHLLRRHRRLALARAPLRERLGVLRRIADVDGDNPVWTDSIRTYEGARAREMETEVRDAMARDDTRAVASLVEEVRSTQWVGAPPANLLRQIELAARKKEQDIQRQTLLGLVHDLNAAAAASDMNAVLALRDRWKEEANRARLGAEDALWKETTPAFEWLAREQERQATERKQRAALLRLEGALNARSSRADLEQLYRTALIHEGGVPEPLEGRYHERLRQLEALGRQRRRALLAAGAIAGVLLIAGVTFEVNQWVQSHRVDDVVKAADEQCKKGDLAGARAALDKFANANPELASAPELTELRDRIRAEVDGESQRIGQLREKLEQLRQAPPEEREPAALEQARRLARTPEEEQVISNTMAARTTALQKTRERREDDFRSALRQLESRVQALEQMVDETPESAEAPALLADAGRAWSRLSEQSAGVSREVQQLLGTLAPRLDVIRVTLEQVNLDVELTEAMTTALAVKRDVAAYTKALQTYIQRLPGTPRGRAFRHALADRSMWLEASEWIQTSASWTASVFQVPPDEAGELAARVGRFVARHRAYVDVVTAREAESCLRAIAQRNPNDPNSAAVLIRQAFAHFLVKGLWVLDENGETYYLRTDVGAKLNQSGGPLVNISYLASLDGTEKRHNVQINRLRSFRRAPQSEVADVVLAMPPDFAARTWEQAMMRIAGLVQKSTMDPILRFMLLDQVLEEGSRGSYPLAEAWAPTRAQLRGANLDLSKVAWIRSDAEADRMRPATAVVLRTLPDLGEGLDKIEKRQRELDATIARTVPELAGWLTWDKRHGWQLRGGPLNPARPVLCVLVRGVNGRETWRSIGRVEGDNATIPGDGAGLNPGVLVYAFREPPVP